MLAINLTCPNPDCAAVFPVGDGPANQAVRCPRCGKEFTASAKPVAAGAGTTVAGRYQTRATLGSGAFGTVYRAYDPQLERDVALKILRPQALASPAAVQRFRREARAAAKMLHPNIVPVFDAGQHGASHYIASAFIPGKTLAALIPDGGMEPRRAVALTVQLADALAYAHGQNVLHRDVKPANILVDGRDHLYLMDFGLAGSVRQEQTRMTRLGSVMGTPSYMPPEQAAGDTPNIGPASDQYAVGVVLYELLTGRTPFEGPTEIVLFNVLKTQPKPPSALRQGIDPALEAICLRAMAKKPADRFPDAAALAAALRAWLRGRPEPPAIPPGTTHVAADRPTLVGPAGVEETLATAMLRRQEKPRSGAIRSTGETAREVPQEARPGGPRRILLAAVAGVLLAGAGLAYWKLRGPSDGPAPVATTGDRQETPPGDSGDRVVLKVADSKEDDGATKPEPGPTPSEAELLYRKDAEKGNVDAQYNLGMCYQRAQRGAVKDLAEAARWFRKAADQGHADARAQLAWHYDNGAGVDRNAAEAVRLYRLAADQKDAWAARNLGHVYYFGRGVPVDVPEAVRWYRAGAEGGDAEAQFWLGNFLADGEGVDADREKALGWWQKAADQKYPEAVQTLEVVRAAGGTVPGRAERLYRKRAEAGDAEAQYQLGLAFANGQHGEPKDEVKAADWYRKAAEQGHSEAQCCLGHCYLNSKGVPPDDKTAFEWYRKAAEQNNLWGLRSVGWFYDAGRGVKQDEDEAVRWYRKAADLGEAIAQYELGMHLLKGKGVAADSTEALKWLRKSADQGNADAQKVLENMSPAK